MEEEASDERTAPASAFEGERRIGYLQGRGHGVQCEPALRGYIHGKVQDEVGFDIPILCRGEVLLDREEGCEIPCGVWVNQETVRECLMIVWPSRTMKGTQEFICWHGNGGTNHDTAAEADERAEKLRRIEGMKPLHGRIEVRVEQVFRHLIVATDDERGLAYARECLVKREWML